MVQSKVVRREALIEAMVRSSAAKGFQATSIADVVATAGASREDFRLHFGDLEDCLIAALDDSLSATIAAVASGMSADKPWRDSVSSAVSNLLAMWSSRPDSAIVSLLESVNASPTARGRHLAGRHALVSLVDRGRSDAPDDIAVPAAASHVACAGAEHLIVDALLADRGRDLPELLPYVLFALYAPFMELEDAVTHSGIGAVPDEQLESLLGLEVVSQDDRFELPERNERHDLIDALTVLAARDGLAKVTPAAVAEEAGVSTERFHANFVDLQTCLRGAYDYAVDHVLFSIQETFDSHEDLVEAVEECIDTAIEWYRLEPEAVHLVTVDFPAHGPAARRHVRRAMRRFLPIATRARDRAGCDHPTPPTAGFVGLACVAGVFGEAGLFEPAGQLADWRTDLSFGALAPLVGAREASTRISPPSR